LRSEWSHSSCSSADGPRARAATRIPEAARPALTADGAPPRDIGRIRKDRARRIVVERTVTPVRANILLEEAVSLVSTEVLPFEATAYHDGEFVAVTDRDLHGKWSVVFFYPADFTFVCPTELGDLADHYDEFQALGVEVYSVSTDTHFTHKAWHDTSSTIGKIPFPMVGDPTLTITRNFDVLIDADGMADRGTFVVDPDGRIQLIEVNAGNVGRNATELLRKIRAAQHVREHPNEACPANWEEGGEALAPSLDLVGKI